MKLTYNLPTETLSDVDDLYGEVVKLVQETGLASASLIQRKLKLGYARSARLLDELENNGIIGPAIGAKPREILIPYNKDGKTVIPHKESEPVKPTFEEIQSKWKKTKYAQNVSKKFEIEIGVDEKGKTVNLDLDKYGNLFIVGSQFTNALDLLNNILVTSMAKYSPDDLRIIAIDGVKGDLIVPNQASHLLTPLIVEPEKSISALKWSVAEIERRMKMENTNNLNKVLILISSYNQVFCFSPAELEDNLYRLIVSGRKYGFYFIIGTDYTNSKMAKVITANSPAKLVFKPTDKKIARDTGIIESADLTSPDEAILETMFEGKKKITINKLNPKQIYEEIFSSEN